MLILAAVFCFHSCELINPDEPVPVYLECDTISFQASSATQGSSSSSIVDLWAYVDGQLVGAYELPAHFPVLSEGSHKITVKPGILVNGIKATRGAYPFYTSFDTTLYFEPGKTYSVAPRSTYLSLAQFKLIEDFEQSGLSFERAGNSDTILNVISGTNGFEGNSGAVYLDIAHPYFNYRSLSYFAIPPGSTVYAELNYKCSDEFNVGIISLVGTTEYTEEVLSIRPSSTWKKIYVNLSDAIGNQALASGYKFYIAATLSPALLNATIYLDNIKVLR